MHSFDSIMLPHWGKSLGSPNNDKSPWWRCPDILYRTEESHWAVQTMTNLLGDDVLIYYTALRKVIGQSKQWQISLVTMSWHIIPHWGKSLGSPNNDKSPWWRCPDILYRTEESHWAVQTMTNLLGDDVQIVGGRGGGAGGGTGWGVGTGWRGGWGGMGGRQGWGGWGV